MVTLFPAFKNTNAAQTVKSSPGLTRKLGRVRAHCNHHQPRCVLADLRRLRRPTQRTGSICSIAYIIRLPCRTKGVDLTNSSSHFRHVFGFDGITDTPVRDGEIRYVFTAFPESESPSCRAARDKSRVPRTRSWRNEYASAARWRKKNTIACCRIVSHPWQPRLTGADRTDPIGKFRLDRGDV